MEQVIAGNKKVSGSELKKGHILQKAFFKHALGSSVESNERILFYRIFW